MSAYSYINGVVYFDDSMDGDIKNDLSDNVYSTAYCHTSDSGSIFFSFGIKEIYLEIFFELLDKWKTYKSLDGESEHPIEVYMTLWYESNNDQVDCIRIRDGKISHRKTFA